MSEIRQWLEGICLGQYGDAFEANHIDMDLLKQVDDQALRDLGMTSAGHRLRIRNAIAKLAPAPVVDASSSLRHPEPPLSKLMARDHVCCPFLCCFLGSDAGVTC